MSSELTILAFYGLWIVVVILLQVLAAAGQVGLVELARSREDMPKLTGVAGRLDRAQNNSIVAMALFAPAVLLVHLQDAATPATLLAAQLFLIARIVYVVVYTTGTPWIRTGSWVLGFLSTVYLYLMVI